MRYRTARLLSLLIGVLLILAGCSTAEEAGQEVETEGAAPAITSEPAIVESEPASEPSLDASDAADDTGDTSAGSIVDLAQENPQLSQLVTAIQAAGLTDALEQANPITVFAPNNEAFQALGQSDLTALLADPQSLGDRLQYHVVEGSYSTSDLSDGQTLTTLEGSDLQVSVDGDTVTVDGAEIVQPDLQAGNGFVHVINGVLQP